MIDKIEKEHLISNLAQPICYPDGTIYDNLTGEQIPRITPENFGRLHLELHELKAILIALLEEE